MLKAFARSRDVLGQPTTVFPSVWSNPEALIADMLSAMAKSGMVSYKELHEDKDDLSFFFLRGRETIQAFNDSLRWLTK